MELAHGPQEPVALSQGCQLGSFQLGLALLQRPGICRKALQGSAYCTVQVLDALQASPVSRCSGQCTSQLPLDNKCHARPRAQTARQRNASRQGFSTGPCAVCLDHQPHIMSRSQGEQMMVCSCRLGQACCLPAGAGARCSAAAGSRCLSAWCDSSLAGCLQVWEQL